MEMGTCCNVLCRVVTYCNADPSERFPGGSYCGEKETNDIVDNTVPQGYGTINYCYSTVRISNIRRV